MRLREEEFMKCSRCEYVEMKMYEVTGDNKMIFRCKQCGNKEIVEMAEIEGVTKEE